MLLNGSKALTWILTLHNLVNEYNKIELLAVDGVMLTDITDEDLEKDLGVKVRLHRVKILDCLDRLKNPVPHTKNKDNSSVMIKVVEGPLIGSEYELTKEETLIGRHSTYNDISIPESFVSRKHCIIYQKSNKLYIKDTGSTTGTFIMATQPIELIHGLLLQIGISEFKVEVEGQSVMMRVYEGPAKGEVVMIKEEGIGIGRDMSNKFSVPDDSQMSSFHASVIKEEGKFYIRDEESTNKYLLVTQIELGPA